MSRSFCVAATSQTFRRRRECRKELLRLRSTCFQCRPHTLARRLAVPVLQHRNSGRTRTSCCRSRSDSAESNSCVISSQCCDKHSSAAQGDILTCESHNCSRAQAAAVTRLRLPSLGAIGEAAGQANRPKQSETERAASASVRLETMSAIADPSAS